MRNRVPSPLGQPDHTTTLTVVAGKATLHAHPDGMTVIQHSPWLALAWQRFDLAAGLSVELIQPDASALMLHRVVGPYPSHLNGQLTANGKVWLLNPAGIHLGPQADIAAGTFVASTLDLAQAPPTASAPTGIWHLRGTMPAAVVHQGRLRAAHGGSIALLGDTVTNAGELEVDTGSVALATGQRMALAFADGGLQLRVDDGYHEQDHAWR